MKYLTCLIISLLICSCSGTQNLASIENEYDSKIFEIVIRDLKKVRESKFYVDHKPILVKSDSSIRNPEDLQLIIEKRKNILLNLNIPESSYAEYDSCSFPDQMLLAGELASKDSSSVKQECQKFAHKRLYRISLPQEVGKRVSAIKVMEYSNTGYRLFKYISKKNREEWEIIDKEITSYMLY